MKSHPLVFLGLVLAGAGSIPAADQSLSEVFKRVNPAIVEIHTKGTDLAPQGLAQKISVAGRFRDGAAEGDPTAAGRRGHGGHPARRQNGDPERAGAGLIERCRAGPRSGSYFSWTEVPVTVRPPRERANCACSLPSILTLSSS